MNMNDYKQALDKISPKDELKNEIISKCGEKPRITRSFNKRKLAPILAAAVIGCTGITAAATAAGGADWFGKLFEKENVVVTEESSKLIAGVENFTCQSDKGISVTPVGVVADERTLYCVLSFDNLPNDINFKDMQVVEFYTQGSQPETLTSYDYDYLYKNEFVCRITTGENSFKDGDNITLNLGRIVGETPLDTVRSTEVDATVSFDINFGDMTALEIDCSETEFNYGFKAGRVRISPLNIIIEKTNFFDTELIWKSITITLNNGTVITADCDGGGGGENEYDAIWTISEPINPDKIASVYLGDLCLYTTQ